jgi:uncharacterized protein
LELMMGRPIQPRRVCCRFQGRGFKPIGQPLRELSVVSMGLDEVEALRLADLEGLYQEAAAERMAVSRATFARVLTRARLAVADALVNQKALLVSPAEVVEGDAETPACPVHWGGPRRGRGCRCRARGEPRHRDWAGEADRVGHDGPTNPGDPGRD